MNIQALAKDIAVEGEYTLEGIDFITNGEQYLMFILGNDQYAVDILCVEEIRSWERPTIIPNAPKHVKGVINMRGVIVPIIDLRIQFALAEPIYTETTVVVVLTHEVQGKKRTMGFVVDAVADVIDAQASEIQHAPAFGSAISQEYIEGLMNIEHQVVTFLNVGMLQTLEHGEG